MGYFYRKKIPEKKLKYIKELILINYIKKMEEVIQRYLNHHNSSSEEDDFDFLFETIKIENNNDVEGIKTLFLQHCSVLAILVNGDGNCKRLCDITGIMCEFTVKFLQKSDCVIIKFFCYHNESYYQYYRKTIDTLKKLFNNQVSYDEICNTDLRVLHPSVSKMMHVLRENSSSNPSCYSEIHPGIFNSLSTEQLVQEWEILVNFNDLSLITINAAKGTPVPQNVVNHFLDQYSSDSEKLLDILVFLVSIFTCNPLVSYGDLPVYKNDERFTSILQQGLQKDEIHIRQVARLLYAWKIRDINYGNAVDKFETSWECTQRIIDLI